MTVLVDTEGLTIPSSDSGVPLFDTSLCDWCDGKGPMLTLNVPEFFETTGGTYDGLGVVSAPLRDVLEEYLLDFKMHDEGGGVDAFAAWLHDYADRLKTANVANNRPA